MFPLLKDVIATQGRALAISVALFLWAAFSLGVLLLARSDLVAIFVPLLGALLLFFWPWMRAFRRVFWVVFFGFYGGLFALEAGLRLFYFGPDAIFSPSRYGPYSALLESGAVRPVDDPELLFALTPGYHDFFMGKPFRINAQGFRGEDFSEERAPGSVRVMAFGTSITMGAGVAEEETYVSALGRKLSEALKRPVEAMNLGVGAYSVRQAFHLAEKMASKYRPDVVIVEVSSGGLYNTGALGGEGVDFKAPPPVSTLERKSFALSAIYPPASLRAKLRKLWPFGEKAALAASPPPASSPTAYVERRIRDLALLGAREGFRVVVLLVRPMSGFRLPDRGAADRERVRAHAEALGVLLVDSYPLFGPAELPDDFVVFPGDLHPNARAHARMAEALAEAIAPLFEAQESAGEKAP